MLNPLHYLLAVNLLTFALYWQDKRASRRRGWRVSEFMLLLMGFLGGSPAGFIAQHMLRHKTKKPSFQVKFWLLVGAQILLLLFPPTILQWLLTHLFA